eukprot:1108281-Ditylum_brightwellii.AAC.1
MAGAKPGLWWTQYLQMWALLFIDSNQVFTSSDGTDWTNNYYQHTHLYPLLQLQCRAGDPTLQICTDTPGNTLPEIIYNLHCYR